MKNNIDIKQITDNCTQVNRDNYENSKLIKKDEELNEHYKKINISKGEYNINGPIVSNFLNNEGERIMYSQDSCHTLIVGGTGSGKSQNYFMPMATAIARSENKPSVFMIDIKGEMYENISEEFKKQGYDIYVADFMDVFSSKRINPLSPAYDAYVNAMQAEELLKSAKGKERTFKGVQYKTFYEWKCAVSKYIREQEEESRNSIEKLSKLIFPGNLSSKDISWEYGARNMFYYIAQGLLDDLHYSERGMTREKFNLCNIARIANTRDDCAPIYEWIENRENKELLTPLYNYFTPNARGTRDGYMSIYGTQTDKFKSLGMVYLSSGNDIEIDEIVNSTKPTAIFLVIDQSVDATNQLAITFINNLILSLKEKYKIDNTSLKREFIFLLDEFANISCFPNIDNLISVLRGYNIFLHLGIQSFNQLSHKYGEEIRNTIMDNCDCVIYYGTNNSETRRIFGESLGKKIGTNVNYNLNSDNELSISISPIEVPLVKDSDLAQLKLGEAYIRVFRKPTIFAKMEPYFKCIDLHIYKYKKEKAKLVDLGNLEKYYYDIPIFKKEKKYDF